MTRSFQRHIFIACICLFIAMPFILQQKKANIADLIDEIAGRYQFDKQGIPIILTVYVKDGTLMVDEPRYPHARMEPIDLDRLEFRAKHEKGLYGFRFFRNKTGKITESQWTVGIRKHPGFKVEEGRLPSQLTLNQLQEDFQQLRRAMEHMHPALYDYTSKQDFDRIFKQKYKILDGSTRLEGAFRIFSTLTAQIGCMHSAIWMPKGYWDNTPGKLFPIKMKFIGENVYAYSSYHETDSIPTGARIISINGKPIEDILKDLKTVISADAYSDNYKKFRLSFRFPLIYSLFYGHPDSFSVVYEPSGDKTQKRAIIHPVPTKRIWGHMIEPRDLDLNFKEESNTAIMTIPDFDYYKNQDKFFGFVDKAFGQIDQKRINNLIIDLRKNNGGDPFCAAHLFSYLIPKPVPYFSKPYGRYARLAEPIPIKEKCFKRDLFILIDGGGASTTGHLLGLLKYHKIGTLIGEETGATFTCHDAHRSFVLRHTRFQVGIATETFASAVQDLPKDRGILPDSIVYQTPEDLADGKDTVLEYALRLIELNHSRKLVNNPVR